MGCARFICGLELIVIACHLLCPAEVVVGVSACYLEYARGKLPDSVGVAAQNCYKVAKGAFTGEALVFVGVCSWG